jgi:DHA1 family inner membrane transport protein
MKFSLPSWDRRTWVVGFGITLGNVAQSAVPWIVGGLMRSEGYEINRAGLMITAEVMTMGVLMLVTARFVHKIPRRAALFSGVGLAVAAQIASCFVHDFGTLALIRAVSGLGFGLVYAVASAIGAGATAPPKTFAAAGIIVLLLGTLINPALGYGLEHRGAEGVFLGVAALCCVMVVPLAALTARPLDDSRAGRHEYPALDQTRVVAAAGNVLTMALMSAAVCGLYVFLEGIAHRSGISPTTLGGGMSAVSLLGASGGLLAMVLSRRFGEIRPLVTGMPVMGALLLMMTRVWTPWAFWLIFVGITATYWCLYPFIFGLAGRIDPGGRAAAATGSGKILLASGGAALAGFLGRAYGVEAYGFAALAICLCATASAAAVGHLTRRIGQRDPNTPPCDPDTPACGEIA